MRDEQWQLFEAAFAKIEPKDDAEKERFDKLKERMRVTSMKAGDVLGRHRVEQAMHLAEGEESQRRMREQGAVAEANREALLAGLEEQAEIIERIARRSA